MYVLSSFEKEITIKKLKIIAQYSKYMSGMNFFDQMFYVYLDVAFRYFILF